MRTVSNNPAPAPLLVAASLASRVQRVFTNVREIPNMERVHAVIDLLLSAARPPSSTYGSRDADIGPARCCAAR